MLKLTIWLFIIPLSLFNAKAQQLFQKTYSADSTYVNYAKDEFSAILPTDNGYLLAGSTQGYQNIGSAGLLMMVDSIGVVQQSQSYRRGYISLLKGIAQASDGNYIVTGATSACNLSNCPTQVLVAKLNPQGQPLWEFNVLGGNNDYGYSIKPAADDNFILSGWYNNVNDSRGYDMLVVKLTTNGDTVWTRILGTDLNEYTYDAAETPTGHVVVAANQSGNIVVVKLKPDGAVDWVKDYGRGAARKIIPTNNGYIIAGHKSAGGVFEITAPFILKVDTNGTPQFYKTFYGGDYDYLSDIKMLPDSGFILCGMTSSFAYDVTDLYLIKCSATGNVAWARAYGGYEYDEGLAVTPLSGSTFAAVGYSSSFNNSNGLRYSAWLLHTDSTGSTGTCQDHTANPIVIDHTVTPVDLPFQVSKKISIAFTNMGIDNFTMNVEQVCPHIIGVGEEVDNTGVSVYPNPTSETFFIEAENAGQTTIRLLNNLGQIVFEQKENLNRTTKITLPNLPAGIYTINLQSSKGNTYKRIVLTN